MDIEKEARDFIKLWNDHSKTGSKEMGLAKAIVTLLNKRKRNTKKKEVPDEQNKERTEIYYDHRQQEFNYTN